MDNFFTKIKKLLFTDIVNKFTDTSAHAANAAPKSIHKGKTRIKEQLSSHWDLDYLSKQELEDIYAKAAAKQDKDNKMPK